MRTRRIRGLSQPEVIGSSGTGATVGFVFHPDERIEHVANAARQRAFIAQTFAIELGHYIDQLRASPEEATLREGYDRYLLTVEAPPSNSVSSSIRPTGNAGMLIDMQGQILAHRTRLQQLTEENRSLATTLHETRNETRVLELKLTQMRLANGRWTLCQIMFIAGTIIYLACLSHRIGL